MPRLPPARRALWTLQYSSKQLLPHNPVFPSNSQAQVFVPLIVTVCYTPADGFIKMESPKAGEGWGEGAFLGAQVGRVGALKHNNSWEPPRLHLAGLLPLPRPPPTLLLDFQEARVYRQIFFINRFSFKVMIYPLSTQILHLFKPGFER